MPAPQPAGEAPFNVGAAFSYGWKKFQEYLAPILIAMVIFFVVTLAVNLIGSLFIGGVSEITDPDDIGIGMFFSFGYFVFGLLSALVSLLIQAAVVREALGKPKATGSISTRSSPRRTWVRSSWRRSAGGRATIGFILCIIPGLVLIFLPGSHTSSSLTRGSQRSNHQASFDLVNRT